MELSGKRALFSVKELDNIDQFATTLIHKGWKVVATDKVYRILRERRLPVKSVHEFVGVQEDFVFPPTMHPKMEAALTVEDYPEKIDLVYDITYGTSEGMDVGGNTLLAMAIKGNKIPVTSVSSMITVVNAIAEFDEVPAHLITNLQLKAAKEIAEYYCNIAEVLSLKKIKYLRAELHSKLLNGENPYQTAELWNLNGTNDPLALTQYDLISPNTPCYTNIVDLDCLTETMSRIICAFRLNVNKEPYVTLASKHGNVCGIGVDYESKSESIRKALWGNPLAIWGGEIMMNFKVTDPVATYLFFSEDRKEKLGTGKWMLDIVTAPAYDQQALTILSQRKNTKIYVNQGLYQANLRVAELTYRFTRGSVVMQTRPDYILDYSKLDWNLPMKDKDTIDDLIIAWVAAFTSFHGGNEIALAKDGQLLGCAGGPSTVEAAETVITRALRSHGNIEGSVFAADAFFPFTDAAEILANAKVNSGVVPAGGLRFNEVKKYFSEHKISVGFIPERFRGFIRH